MTIERGSSYDDDGDIITRRVAVLAVVGALSFSFLIKSGFGDRSAKAPIPSPTAALSEVVSIDGVDMRCQKHEIRQNVAVYNNCAVLGR